MKKDELQIYLITYNRRDYLVKTLEKIFSEKSPIKNFDITIINNASTDGTDDVILEYQKRFRNLQHIRNCVNVGGSGNIIKAYELATQSRKKYIWILCDDDIFNFSNWHEVEEAMDKDADIICVSDYCFPKNKKDNKAYQATQLTFIPACIFKREHITSNIISLMYEAAYTLFPQLTYVFSIINNDGFIYVLSEPIMYQGLHFNTKVADNSYIRGNSYQFNLERKRYFRWILGYSNMLTLLNDKKLIKECMDVAIPAKDIYCKWKNFYYDMRYRYLHINTLSYFYEIYKLLKFKRKVCFWLSLLKPRCFDLYFIMLNNLGILMKINFHNFIARYR